VKNRDEGSGGDETYEVVVFKALSGECGEGARLGEGHRGERAGEEGGGEHRERKSREREEGRRGCVGRVGEEEGGAQGEKENRKQGWRERREGQRKKREPAKTWRFQC
jgi:hypothetical protein